MCTCACVRARVCVCVCVTSYNMFLFKFLCKVNVGMYVHTCQCNEYKSFLIEYVVTRDSTHKDSTAPFISG